MSRHIAYYHYKNGQFISGDSIAKVLEQLPQKPKFNDAFILRYLESGIHFLNAYTTETIFEGIMRVPWGFEVIYDGKQAPQLKKRWHIDDAEPEVYQTKKAYLNRFRELLNQAVEKRLNPYAPVGVELSGGLDSACIAACLRASHPNLSIVGFSHGCKKTRHPLSKKRVFDETLYSRKIAKCLSIQQKVIDQSQQENFLNIIAHFVSYAGTFAEVSFPLLNHRCYEMAHDLGIKQLYSGFGGDEVATQTAWHYLNELKSAQPSVYYYEKWMRRLRAYAPKTYFRNKRHPLRRSQNDLTQFYTDEVVAAITPVISFDFKQVANLKEIHRLVTHGAFSGHMHNRMEYSRLMANAYGLTVYHPMLDEALLAFCHHVPSKYKRRHGVGRQLPRQAFKGLLPNGILMRPDKHGRSTGDANFYLSSVVRELVLALFSDGYQGHLKQFVNIQKVRHYCLSNASLQGKAFDFCLFLIQFLMLERCFL